MVDSKLPPEGSGGGRGTLMVVALVLLVAVLLGWAYLDAPLGSPNPSATGTPPTAPAGAGQVP